MFFSKFMKSRKPETNGDEPLLNLKKGAMIDFHDNLLPNLPMKDFNILENGPYEVVGVNRTSETIEYAIRGGKLDALLEVEKKDGRNIILIQTALTNYPSLLFSVRERWREDIREFELNGLKYYLVDDGEELDDGEECSFWDYYSNPVDEGYKLFIGVQDYGEDDSPELEFYMGFEIPDRSIKDIIPVT